jgi:hypothetical protein
MESQTIGIRRFTAFIDHVRVRRHRFVERRCLLRSKEARTDEMLDLHIQLILKQGQVEIQWKPADLPPDQYRHTDAELIHRGEVENLNQSIIVRSLVILWSFTFRNISQESANIKVRQMEKTKQICNDLHTMEWWDLSVTARSARSSLW